MLTLPDTDQPLRQARYNAQKTSRNGNAPDILRQHITLQTPWLATGKGAQQSIDMTITYRDSAQGWSAATSITSTPAPTAPHSEDAIYLDAPVALQPIAIQKPWGQEIWFSAIEQRGESTVRQGDVELPLSHYLALAPERLTKRAPPILLKILDPAPRSGTGNLYFETHDTKQEVYVVTHVDASAWPDGSGAIRLGMNQASRKNYRSDKEFRAAYLAAVASYERIRRKIDGYSNPLPGDKRAPSEYDQRKDNQEEARLRVAMEDFTATVPLLPGDVVQVAPGIPHSLQHGVRVFEFQTPTYERNIISFNQQVLTQNHWDSSYAIASMSLEGPTAPTLETISNKNGVLVERIVNFDEFSVLRIVIEPHSTWPINHAGSYAILAMIAGVANLQTEAGALQLIADTHPADDQQPGAQQFTAAFLPASAAQAKLVTGQHPVTLLVAVPKPATAGTIPVARQKQTEQ